MATAVLPMPRTQEVGEELPDEFRRLAVLLEEVAYDERRTLLIQLRDRVRYAIASSLHVSAHGYRVFENLSRKREEREKAWEQLQRDMPRLGIGWILADAHEVYQWLTSLTNTNLIGGIEWTSSDTCRYHYYLHEGHTTLVWKKMRRSTNFDSRRPVGEQQHYTFFTTKRVRRTLVRERHTHHLVDARISRLEEWKGILPRRVARFLKNVPPWIMPLLSITEGTIVQEDICSASLVDQTVEEESSYVIKESPAITLGPFTLAGWSSDDVSWRDRYLHRPFRGSKYKRWRSRS